ncbi:MAG: hypothetical protein MZV63_15070 [Marinilabiliales bacterium]|nr:hypothetical protein [Marinilabiliales bacterium]
MAKQSPGFLGPGGCRHHRESAVLPTDLCRADRRSASAAAPIPPHQPWTQSGAPSTALPTLARRPRVMSLREALECGASGAAFGRPGASFRAPPRGLSGSGSPCATLVSWRLATSSEPDWIRRDRTQANARFFETSSPAFLVLGRLAIKHPVWAHLRSCARGLRSRLAIGISLVFGLGWVFQPCPVRAAEFRISEANLTADGRLEVRFEGAPGYYHRLLTGADLQNVAAPVALSLGNVMALGVVPGEAHRFVQVRFRCCRFRL